MLPLEFLGGKSPGLESSTGTQSKSPALDVQDQGRGPRERAPRARARRAPRASGDTSGSRSPQTLRLSKLSRGHPGLAGGTGVRGCAARAPPGCHPSRRQAFRWEGERRPTPASTGSKPPGLRGGGGLSPKVHTHRPRPPRDGAETEGDKGGREPPGGLAAAGASARGAGHSERTGRLLPPDSSSSPATPYRAGAREAAPGLAPFQIVGRLM